MYQTVVTSMADAQVITSQAGIQQPVQIVTATPQQQLQIQNGQTIEFKTEPTVMQHHVQQQSVPTATQAVEVVAMETQQVVTS